MALNLTPTVLTLPTLDVGDGIETVEYVNGRLFVTTWNGATHYSTNDGTSWTLMPAPITGVVRMKYVNARWFAFGTDRFWHSADFAAWTAVLHSALPGGFAPVYSAIMGAEVAYFAGTWVFNGQSGGNQGQYVTSLDNLATFQVTPITAAGSSLITGTPVVLGTTLLMDYASDVVRTTTLSSEAWLVEGIGTPSGGTRGMAGPMADGRAVHVRFSGTGTAKVRGAAGGWTDITPAQTLHANAWQQLVAWSGSELAIWDYLTDLTVIWGGAAWAEYHPALPANWVRYDVAASSSAYYVLYLDSGAGDTPHLYKYDAVAIVEGTSSSSGTATSSMAGSKVREGLASSGVTLTSTAAPVLLLDATLQSATLVVGTHAATDVIQALLDTLVSGGTLLPQGEDGAYVWVVNTATSASTRYEGFPFNSFAKIGEAFFGARTDGIYQLDGADDAGTPVQAMADFGRQSFGTSHGKRVDYAYLGTAADGRLVLRVVAEGKEYFYTARRTDEELGTQRVDLGRGLKAAYLRFELYNEAGADFELSSVEFAPLVLKRRI